MPEEGSLREQPLSDDELAQQQSSDLPERDAMSLVNLNAAVPVNAAIAANVLSDGSTADAGALQNTPIGQTTS
jgi:hypothetical protein